MIYSCIWFSGACTINNIIYIYGGVAGTVATTPLNNLDQMIFPTTVPLGNPAILEVRMVTGEINNFY